MSVYRNRLANSERHTKDTRGKANCAMNGARPVTIHLYPSPWKRGQQVEVVGGLWWSMRNVQNHAHRGEIANNSQQIDQTLFTQFAADGVVSGLCDALACLSIR